MSDDELKKFINDYGGIQPPHLAFYNEAIRFNSQAAMNSIDYLAEFIEMTNRTKGNYELSAEKEVHILDNIQNIMGHAAAMSRFFWSTKDGVHKLHKKRSQTLRAHFGLTESSALKDKALRNQLEHLDESLDNYLWAKPIVGNIIPAYVGGEPERDGVPTHFFRAFYIDTGIFEALGIRHEVQPIVDELCKIYRTLHGDHT